MTQIATLLAIATAFIGLWTLNNYILQSWKGGGLIREIKLHVPMQKLELKIQGGLRARGRGRNYGTCTYIYNYYFS